MRDGNRITRRRYFKDPSSSEPTYEGWKRQGNAGAFSARIRSEPTYEGWKPIIHKSELHYLTRSEPTYEGWKLNLPVGPPIVIQVPSLPMRDGNTARTLTQSFKEIRSEPTYEGWKRSTRRPRLRRNRRFRAYL